MKLINYLIVLVVSLLIWRWYWFTNIIGYHDAFDAMHYMETIYNSYKSWHIPLWQPYAEMKQYFFAGAEYPALNFTFPLVHILDFPTWLKTHYYLYLLFGACGMVALFERLKVKSLLPSLFSLVAFFSGAVLSFVYFQYTWIVMWSFFPWVLLFWHKKQWTLLSIVIALFIMNYPALSFVWGMTSLVFLSLFYKNVFKTIKSIVIGGLLAMPVLLPTLVYNWQGTMGRNVIPMKGFLNPHQFITAFVQRFGQPFCIDMGGRITMWQEWYSYIGIIPALLIILGLFTKDKLARCCFLISILLLIMSCGEVMIFLKSIHFPLASISPQPPRMTVPAIFWACLGTGISLSRFMDKKIYRRILLLLLLIVSLDYIFLFNQFETIYLKNNQGKFTTEILSNPIWRQRNMLKISREGELMVNDKLKKKLSIVEVNNRYQIKFKDWFIYIGLLISLLTIAYLIRRME